MLALCSGFGCEMAFWKINFLASKAGMTDAIGSVPLSSVKHVSWKGMKLPPELEERHFRNGISISRLSNKHTISMWIRDVGVAFRQLVCIRAVHQTATFWANCNRHERRPRSNDADRLPSHSFTTGSHIKNPSRKNIPLCNIVSFTGRERRFCTECDWELFSERCFDEAKHQNAENSEHEMWKFFRQTFTFASQLAIYRLNRPQIRLNGKVGPSRVPQIALFHIQNGKCHATDSPQTTRNLCRTHHAFHSNLGKSNEAPSTIHRHISSSHQRDVVHSEKKMTCEAWNACLCDYA